jgi:hypothetical protein
VQHQVACGPSASGLGANCSMKQPWSLPGHP